MRKDHPVTSSSTQRSHVLDSSRPTAAPGNWQDRLRLFGYVGRPRTDILERLVPPFPKPSTRLWELTRINPALAHRVARVMDWLGPVLIAVLAGAIRFWHLGQPRDLVFDETYYAKDAWSLLQLGYEGT